MNRLGYAAAVAALTLASAGASSAGEADGEETARQGVVTCGDTNFVRQGGTEVHFTNFNLRTLTSDTPISIDRVVAYAATGAVLFDSELSGFGAFESNLIGPGDRLLDPKQSAQLSTDTFLPFLPDALRPLQVEFSWSAPERVLTLQVSRSRVARQRDPLSGQQLQERSRDGGTCRNVSLR